MSTSIEQRVVQMRFDNKQFEAGVSQTMSTIDKFKAKLDFRGATKGLDDVNKAAAKVSLQPVGDQVDRVSLKFDALAVVAATALGRITNAAITTGKNMVKALTLDPVTTGFNEYETKLNSIQTIMSNTASKGTTMEDVTRVIDELNTYADKTIYNFAEMTRNIGTFTAAGVGLEESAKAIQGIANLAAASGSNSQQASTAMYQLSQALAAGTVKLMDWNSVVNAGMGGEKFQNALKQTAREHGVAIDSIIEKQGSFRESLSQGWLSADILNETLHKFTVEGAKEYAQAMLESGKYTQEQADALIAEAQAMEDAATKVKTFTQLWDTLRESAQSGWSQTWEIIVGDFEEAKELFTDINDVLSGFIGASADARNAALTYWKDLGGRTRLIEAARAAFEALVKPLTAVKSAIDDILFPGTTYEKGTWLYRMTVALREFIKSLVMSDEAVNTLRVAVKALLLPVKAVIEVVKVGIGVVTGFIKIIFRLIDALLALPSKIGGVADPFRKLFGSERYERISKSLSVLVEGFGSILNLSKELLKVFVKIVNSGLAEFFKKLNDIFAPLGEWILDRVVEGFEALSKLDFKGFGTNGLISLKKLSGGFSSISKICEFSKNVISDFLSRFEFLNPINILKGISDSIGNIFTNISNFFKGIDMSPAIDAIVDKFNFLKDIILNVAKAVSDFTGKLTASKILVFGFGLAIINFIVKFTSVLDEFSEVAKGVGKVLTGAGSVLNSTSRFIWALSERVKGNTLARSIVPITVAIGLLAVSLIALSQVNPEGLKRATISLAELMGAFTGMTLLLGVINKFLVKTPEIAKNLQMVGVAMIAMAGSVAILSGALFILSKVDMEGMGQRLLALFSVIGVMVISVAALGRSAKDSLGKAAIILSFATAMALIARAIATISQENVALSADTVIALIAIVIMLKSLSKVVQGVKFTGGAGLILLVMSLDLFAKMLVKLSRYDTGDILIGLINFIPIVMILKRLASVIGGSKAVAKLGGQILAMSISILILQKAIEKLGQMNPAVLKKGAAVVSSLILVFGLMQRLATVGMKESAKIKGSFISMSLAILVLGLAINYIGGLNLQNVVQGTIVVSALMLLLTMLASAVGPAKGSTKAIISLTVCLGLLISAIALLTLIDPKELLYSSVSLSAAMLSLGAMIKLIGNIKIGEAFSKVGLLTIVFVELGYAFEKLTAIDPKKLLVTATALSEVMLALGVTTRLFKSIDSSGKGLVKTGGVMVAMLAAAGTVVYLLNQMPIQEGLIEKTGALSILLVTLAGISTIMSKLNAGFISSASAAGGIAAFMGILSATLAALGWLFSQSIGEYTVTSFLETGIDTVNGLLKVMPAVAIIGLVSGVLSALKIDTVACTNASVAIGVVITVVTGFVTLIGALFQNFPNLEADLDKAVQVFPKIGAALGGLVGSFSGAVLSGLASGLMESLNVLASGLSSFIQSMMPFFEGLNSVDASKVEAVSSLGQMILALTAADLLNSINPFIASDPLSRLADQLTAFGPKFAQFATSISGIDPTKVNACAVALKAFADVIVAIPQDVDFLGIFSSTTDFEGFGEGMKSFAEAFKKFAEVIDSSTLSKETVDRTKYAMDALTDMANNIPRSGGILQTFFGDRNMASFGTQLKDYATGLVGFFKIISGQDETVGAIEMDFDLVNRCANASKALADFAANVPSTGGHLQKITGVKDLEAFGTQLSGYARGLVKFFNVLNGKDSESGAVDINKELVDKAMYAGSAFAELAKQIPGTGGVWQAFAGSLKLDEFGDDIGKFGKGLYDFFTLFKDAAVTDADVTTAKNAGLAFSDLVNNVTPNEGAVSAFKGVNLELYGTELKGFGEGIKGFYDAISGVKFTIVDNAVASIKSIIGLEAEMEDIDTAGAINLRSYLIKLGEVGLTDFGTTFANGKDQLRLDIETTLTSALQTAASNIGVDDIDITNIMAAIITAFVNKKTVITDLVSDVLSWFKEAFDAKKDLIESCGATIIESLYDGSNTKFTEYVTKFEELANSIVSTFSKAFNIIGSTSLEFQSIGKYCIAGFMKGFESEADLSTSRIRAIANNIAATTENALGVNSPSVRFSEIGMYCMQGLANGIEENAKNTIDKAVKMGENLLESVKEFFGIKSPSTVMRDEVGRYIVDGIAEGIKYNTSAEEAAAQKAQNIVNAFKTEFDKLDQVLNTKNLEYELWQAMNPNAPAGQVNLKQAEMLDAQMKIQAERVNAANAQYQATLKALGDSAGETNDAYNTYLEEKINLADLAAQFSELQRNNTQAFRKFADIYSFNMEALEGYGFSKEDIEKVAMDQSGWINPKVFNKTGSIEDIMNQYLEETSAGTANVEVVIKESVQRAVTQASNTAKQGGKQIVESVTKGVQEASDESSTGGVFDELKDLITESLPGESAGKTTGENLISGVEEGINGTSDGLTRIGGSIFNTAKSIRDSFNIFLGEHSPSIYTEESGKNLLLGLSNGIMDPASNAQVYKSVEHVSANAIGVFDPAPEQYRGVGLSMMAGLTNGIMAGASGAINAAVSVAQRALLAAQAALGINSPSREFYRIGKMIDQGLSNGILDDYSIVDKSISKLVNRVQQSEDDFVIKMVVDVDDEDLPTWGDLHRAYTLEWDALGNLVPYAYTNSSRTPGKWITLDKASYDSIRDMYYYPGEGLRFKPREDLTPGQLNALRIIQELANEGYAPYKGYRNDPVKREQEWERRAYNEGRGMFDATKGEFVNYNITQNITSPTPANPAENARQLNNVMGRLVNSSNNRIHGGSQQNLK